MLSEFRVGPVLAQEGSVNQARASKYGALVVADGHGRYTEATRTGNVFTAANTAVLALSVNSGSATGIILTNPVGSGKLLSVLDVCVSIASLPAGQASLVLIGGSSTTAVTQTTPIVFKNSLLGGSGATGVALVASVATLPAASFAINRIIGGGPAATIAASTSFPAFIRDEVAGLIVLYPGSFISLQAVTTAVSVMASISWEELPL
jgi:putative intracellular protease/amidase